MALILIMCVSVGEVCVCSQVVRESSASHTQADTHTQTHTCPSTQAHTGALIHCRDYRWSMTWLTLGSTGLCLRVPILLGPPFVCAHSTRHCEAVCVCIFPCLRRGLSGEGKRKKRGKKGRNQSKCGAREERRERRRQENMLSLSLSPSLPPSLPHSPTHSSKYNDHRKVISKLSQSEDSEPTENHKKRGNGETEETGGYHSPVVYAYRKEQLVMRERGWIYECNALMVSITHTFTALRTISCFRLINFSSSLVRGCLSFSPARQHQTQTDWLNLCFHLKGAICRNLSPLNAHLKQRRWQHTTGITAHCCLAVDTISELAQWAVQLAVWAVQTGSSTHQGSVCFHTASGGAWDQDGSGLAG